MTKKENKHKKIRKGKKAVFAALFIVMAIVVGTLIHSLFLKDTADSKPIDNTKVVENETYAMCQKMIQRLRIILLKRISQSVRVLCRK